MLRLDNCPHAYLGSNLCKIMPEVNINAIVSYVWGCADILRDRFVRGKYRDVILPMTLIRRLDAVLEPTKGKVLEAMKDRRYSGLKGDALKAVLCEASGCGFYNTSQFTLKDIPRATSIQQLEDNFKDYLHGFSSDVREILKRFNFEKVTLPLLLDEREAEADNGTPRAEILIPLLERLLSPTINLSPFDCVDAKGNVLPGLDNHAMGTMFEELLRRFNEENNEEAGEHFTPRDIISLMADIIFEPVADSLAPGLYTIYDAACGTGGMLTVGEDRLAQLAEKRGIHATMQLFGQEIGPETYAIAKADALIKGRGDGEFHIACASTLSQDAYSGKHFDFMMSNPPYGKAWGDEIRNMTYNGLANKKDITDPRFCMPGYAGDPEYAMLPDAGDGQLLFLLNMVAKMKDTPQGSRIATVHNGSSLFTGGAGSGESNARRYLFEQDLVEAIIQLPDNIFYNTGITTYIWLLTNRKRDDMKGKVQLINATRWFEPLRKNLGKRNCEMTAEHRARVLDLVLHPRDTDCSVVLENNALAYREITVERPLLLSANITDEALSVLEPLMPKKSGEDIMAALRALPRGKQPHETIWTALDGIKLTQKVQKDIIATLCVKDEENGKPVQDTKTGGPVFDKDLRETELLPISQEISDFMVKEVLPYAPDSVVTDAPGKVGYEISFAKYFYKPEPIRAVADIITEIRELEAGSDTILNSILGEA